MAHGSTHLQERAAHDLRHVWLVAFGRGGILGVVISLHLVLLALLFGPVMPLEAVADGRPEYHDALRIRLLPAARPRRAGPEPKRTAQATRVPRRALATTAVADATVEPTPTAARLAPPVVSGDYRSPMLGGRVGMAAVPSAPRLPGAGVAYVRGIVLNDRPGLRQVVRVMAHASRCQYTRMKMGQSSNQFITRQLMERALEADGCGPHTTQSAAGDTVEAISHKAIFGD